MRFQGLVYSKTDAVVAVAGVKGETVVVWFAHAVEPPAHATCVFTATPIFVDALF